MAKIDRAVLDAWPLIHLSQIDAYDILKVVKKIIIPQGVLEEIKLGSIKLANIKVVDLSSESKDISKVLSEKYSLGLGESQVIALAKQENIKFIFTDDMDARTVAKSYWFEVHGTIGLALKAFKEGIITKGRAISVVNDLDKKSTLFLTTDLIKYILNEIE